MKNSGKFMEVETFNGIVGGSKKTMSLTRTMVCGAFSDIIGLLTGVRIEANDFINFIDHSEEEVFEEVDGKYHAKATIDFEIYVDKLMKYLEETIGTEKTKGKLEDGIEKLKLYLVK